MCEEDMYEILYYAPREEIMELLPAFKIVTKLMARVKRMRSNATPKHNKLFILNTQ